MPDFRAQIPAAAWLNAHIVLRAENLPEFQACIKSVIDEAGGGIANHRVTDQSFIVSLLYCLLVVPKELWLSEDGVHHLELESKGLLQYFEVVRLTARPDETETACLLRRMRNAVAHVHYTVDADTNWRFWDQSRGESEPGFIVRTDKTRIGDFLSAIGPYLVALSQARGGAETGE